MWSLVIGEFIPGSKGMTAQGRKHRGSDRTGSSDSSILPFFLGERTLRRG